MCTRVCLPAFFLLREPVDSLSQHGQSAGTDAEKTQPETSSRGRSASGDGAMPFSAQTGARPSAAEHTEEAGRGSRGVTGRRKNVGGS